MLVNLYVQVPAVHPGASAPEYFSGVVQGVAWALLHAPLLLLVHAIVGLLLFLAALIYWICNCCPAESLDNYLGNRVVWDHGGRF